MVLEHTIVQELGTGRFPSVVTLPDNRYGVAALRSGGRYTIRTHTKDWQLVEDVEEIVLFEDAVDIAARVQLLQHDNLYYVFFPGEDSFVTLRIYNEDFTVQSEYVLTNVRASLLSAVEVSDTGIYVFVDAGESDTLLYTYSREGELQEEKILPAIGTIVDVYEDAGDLIIVSELNEAITFTKYSQSGELVQQVASEMRIDDYEIVDFVRQDAYIYIIGQRTTANTVESQIWIVSDNLLTQYPSVQFTTTARQPHLVSSPDGLNVVFTTQVTEYKGDSEVTTYSLNVDTYTLITGS